MTSCALCIVNTFDATSILRLELLTPNLVHLYSIAVAWYAVSQRSKVQRSRSHGYENRSVASLLVTRASAVYYCCATCGRCQCGSACRYNCLCFVVNTFDVILILRHINRDCLTLPVSPGAGCSVTDAGEQRGSYNTQMHHINSHYITGN